MHEQIKRILLVEDNDDNALIYKAVLEHHGYHVTHAADGEAALRLVEELIPDLILMDISLPKRDGWECTEIIKRNPHLASIPIVAVTAHAFAADRAKAMSLGFTGYLAKPVEPRRVVAEVEKLIGKARVVA